MQINYESWFIRICCILNLTQRSGDDLQFVLDMCRQSQGDAETRSSFVRLREQFWLICSISAVVFFQLLRVEHRSCFWSRSSQTSSNKAKLPKQDGATSISWKQLCRLPRCVKAASAKPVQTLRSSSAHADSCCT